MDMRNCQKIEYVLPDTYKWKGTDRSNLRRGIWYHNRVPVDFETERVSNKEDKEVVNETIRMQFSDEIQRNFT